MLGLPPRPRSPSSPMAVSSSTAVNVDPGDASPSKSPSDAGSLASDSAFFPCSPDANVTDYRDSSPASLEDAEIQSATQLRSEEYRQLFRLPPEEALVEDFNCACQENILIQGHMYLFAHYICFYSNIFGFETKKIIRFRDITSVKRAKTAGIFPNAIEVLAGGKKHFFASFLSRDEAFRLIVDGCSQHGNGAEALMEKQDSSSGESSFRENRLEPGNLKISNCEEELEISNREEDPTPDDSRLTPAPHNDNASTTAVPGLQDDAYQDEEQVQVLESQPSFKAWIWKVEDSDAPKITEEYTKVAESKFPIKVEEFFNLFFSDEDDAVDFIDSFHRKCGDKDFKCSSWSPHDQFGHARNVSFQHPIKIYLGAKFGSCQEMQKFKVYKNSQLVVETSQEINDVPYGDYFRVEGLWDVKGEDDGSCKLCVYINVAFSKKTMFKGKIVQSTLEECQEAYAIFVSMAHDLLRERNIEKAKDNELINPDYSITSPNQEVHSERETNVSAPSKKDPRPARLQHVTGNNDNSPSPGNWTSRVSSALPINLRGSLVKFWSDIRIQTNSQPLIAISFLVILLMQLSIVVLLARPQNIQIIAQRGDYRVVEQRASSPEMMVSLLEKRIYNLKDEMLVVESWLERMRWEHTRLSEQLGYLEKFQNPTKRTD